MGNIHPLHFKEIKSYRHLNYTLFRPKIISIFKEPDLRQAMMRELMTVQQESDESLAEFMAKIQNLADRAFHGQTEESKQQVAVNAFCNGLIDQDAARLVAVQAKGSVAGALNIAASVGAYSKHPMKARKYKPDTNPYNYNLFTNETTNSMFETSYEESHGSVQEDYDENDLE